MQLGISVSGLIVFWDVASTGFIAVLQGLKPRQLAILFRNNHFNTLFKFEDALYLLVTDQGYLHEQASSGPLSGSQLWGGHYILPLSSLQSAL